MRQRSATQNRHGLERIEHQWARRSILWLRGVRRVFAALFRLRNQLIERRLQTHVSTVGGANGLLHFGRRETPSLKLNITFSDARNGYTCELQGADDESQSFADVRTATKQITEMMATS